VNSAAGLVYVANSADDTVSVISEQTDEVVDLWEVVKPVNGNTPPPQRPFALVLNAVSNNLYVANFTAGTVAVLDGSTGTIKTTITVGTEPNGIVLDNTTQTLYVSNLYSESISMINAATGVVEKVNGFIGVGSSYGIAVDSVTHSIFVTENHVGDGTVDTFYGTLNVFQGMTN
jgi:YVTN family beta-propeller protein